MLDVMTPRGKEFVAHEGAALAMIGAQYPGFQIAHTPRDEPAVVDGVVVRNGTVMALFESKCRDMTLNDLRERFDNEWLVTFEKLQHGADVAGKLRVPFAGYLYLIPERVLLCVRIADKFGNFIVPMRIAQTETIATSNGGTAVRTNAYINMAGAKEIWNG